MKKIKLKSLIDPTADNIDDIYGNIVEELNLNKKAESNKQINSLLNKAKQNPQSVKKVKDNDLLLSMTKRLNLVETQLKEANNKLKLKDLEINKLKNQITDLKEQITENENSKEENDYCENCIKLNKIIDHQSEYITKLYTFLQENGITIVKSAIDKKSKEELETKLKSLEHDLNKLNIDNGENEILNKDKGTNPDDYDQLKLPRTIDIKTIIRRIDEMNSLIYENEGQNSKFETEDGKIFKLKQRKELLISFYKNGLIIEGYQFFPYQSENASKILQDILDGYSPFILKERYPHGVLMKVENHCKFDYDSNNKNNDNVKSVNDPKVQKYLSGKEFVNLFPEKIIKNGNVLNIREDMEKLLKINKNEKSEFDDNQNEFDLFDKKEKDKINEKDISKIQIKIVTIDKTITVNAKKNSDINSLFDFVKKYTNDNLKKVSPTLKVNNISDYGFIMAYPFKLITYENKKDKKSISTLEQLGLFPSIFITFDTLSKYQKK